MVVDIMPIDASVLGLSNRWYSMAFETAEQLELERGLRSRLTTAPCFLATKLEAFAERGHEDYQASTDIDDVVSLLDGRAELIDEIRAAPGSLRVFLVDEARRLCEDRSFLESISWQLQPDRASQARAAIIVQRLDRIRASGEVFSAS